MEDLVKEGQMEAITLENILKNLEKLDIHSWTIVTKNRGIDITNTILTAETNGLKFYFDNKYCLSIEDLETGYTISCYYHDKQNKILKKMMEEFYKKTYTALINYQAGKIEEKLENFLGK